MGSSNGKSNILFIKYLIIAGTVAIIGIVLAILVLLMITRQSSSGYAIGLAIKPAEVLLVGIQILVSLVIAYFIGPKTVQDINEGKSGFWIGGKSLLICWTAPWMFLTILFALQHLSWDYLLLNGIVAFIPAFVMGPIIGVFIKRKFLT